MGIIGQKIGYIFLSTGLIIVGVFIIIIILLLVFQSRLIYFPIQEIIMTPEQIGLSYETVHFKAADGKKLSGWFIPAKKSRGVILFCHGNGGNISHRMDSIQIFYNLGLSIFIFDYRGYGESEGKPTENGTYHDAEAALHYIIQKKQVTPADIIIFGRSLGGVTAAWLAKKYSPKVLIIESTFTSIPDIAAELYPFLPVKLLSRFDYNAIDYLSQVHCPVLIVHSRDDEIISFRHGQRLFEIANEPKEILKIIGTHNEGFLTSGQIYKDGLNSFISKYIKK